MVGVVHHNPTEGPTMLAYSYLRFSHPDQVKGDSFRRQTDGTLALCKRKGWTLDDLTYRDLGVSAFRGANRHKGALGAFLKAVQDGKVRKGSVLIVESLDRLSRQNIDDAYELLRSILKAGVTVATLNPEREYTAASLRELIGIVEPLIIMSRANEESETKSKRIRARWEAARVKRQVGGACPAWLRITESRKFAMIPEHVATVRQIFAWIIAGRGLTWITKTLNDTGIPLMGRAKNKAKYWRKGYVALIARSRAVIGEGRPCTWDPVKHRQVPTGQVWPDYYPAVVSAADFWRAQGLLTQRKVFVGRKGRGVANLFQGLAHDARDGRTMRCVDKGPRGGRSLVSSGAVEGAKGSVYYSFPLDTLEKAFLAHVKELRVEDVLPREPNEVEDEIATLKGQKADLEARIEHIKREIESRPNLELLLDTLDRLADSLKGVKKRLEAAESKKVNGEKENLEAVQSLAEMLEQCPDSEREDLRSRLQAAIRQVVSEIWILIVKLTDSWRAPRVAACQVWFRGSEQPRSLLVGYPAGAWSLPPDDVDTGRIDLRRRADAQALAKVLAGYNPCEQAGL
jgi:DNA invertase Pin-like site-specific DNA recombinase